MCYMHICDCHNVLQYVRGESACLESTSFAAAGELEDE
jgi:hypothetical protein